MVQIIQENRRPSTRDIFASTFSRMGEGLGAGIEQGARLARENAALKKQYGIDLSGVESPELRSQIIADELRFGRAKRAEQAKVDIPLVKGRGEEEKIERAEKKELPSFEVPKRRQRGVEARREEILSREGEVLGEKEALGRDETLLRKGEISRYEEPKIGREAPIIPERTKFLPVLSPEEQYVQAQQLAIQRAEASGMPPDLEGALHEVQNLNAQNLMHNQNAFQYQQHYGELGQSAVSKYLGTMPEDTQDEINNRFARRAEELSGVYTSDAQVRSILSDEAKKIKEKFTAAESAVPRAGTFRAIRDMFLGKTRSAQQQLSDIKSSIKPLLDEGLYDTARHVVANKGWGPEMTEKIVSDLDENTKKALANFKIYPSALEEREFRKKTLPGSEKQLGELRPKEQLDFTDRLEEFLQQNSNANLMLVRAELENKGINWRSFKDALDVLRSDGRLELSREQMKQNKYLDQPPLDQLDELMEKLGWLTR